MPNHVTSIIVVKDAGGTTEKEIRAAFLNDRSMVDFNVIIPMPDCLKDFEPHSGITGTAESLIGIPLDDNPLLSRLQAHNRKRDLDKWYGKTEVPFTKEERKMVLRALSNFEECGCIYWYDWSSTNWGTKWNAYSQPDEGYPIGTTEYMFETAWSHPEILIKALSEKLPDVTFLVRFANEDIGSNCGQYEIKNAIAGVSVVFADVAEKRKFAFGVRNPGDDPRECGYDENWEYSEEIHEQWEKEQTS